MFHIIIPTFNREKTILRSIKSLQQQNTVEDYHIYIVDDGSTDSTAQKIKNLKDTHISYFFQKNGGVSSARNTGIFKLMSALQKNDFVMFLDSDDVLKKDAFEKISQVVNKYKNISYFAFGVENEKGEKKFFNKKNEQILDFKDALAEKEAKGEFFRIVRGNIFLDKKDTFRFPNGLNGGEDILWLQVNKYYKLCVSNSIVRTYYQNNIGITRDLLDKKKIDNFLGVTEKYLELFGDDLKKVNKILLGKHMLVYARMLALSGKRIKSMKIAYKGLVSSFDIKRFIVYLLSLLPFGVLLNNFLIKIL